MAAPSVHRSFFVSLLHSFLRLGPLVSLLWLVGFGSVLAGCPGGRNLAASPSRPSAQRRAPADLAAHPGPAAFLRQSGLNLPWISYGHDVGWPRRVGTRELFGFRFYPQLVRRKAALPPPMRLLRVWMLADDRAGNLAGRDPQEFTTRCIRDLSAFMEDTGPDTVVIWVLYDFMLADGRGRALGGRAGEHRRLVTTVEGARRALALVSPCIRALQDRYGDRIIWDVFNEPLNGVCLTTTDEHQAGLEAFVRLHMEAILTMGGRVSVGARNLQSLRRTWSGLWRHLAAFARKRHLPPNRLVVQFHHYPGQELDPDSSLRTLDMDALRRRLGLDRATPVVLGESWPLSGFTLSDYHRLGFAGALFWQDARLPLPMAEVRRQIADLAAGPANRHSILPAKPVSLRPVGSVGHALPTDRSQRPAAALSVPLDVARCRIQPGPPSTAWWRRLIGAGAEAFSALSVQRAGGLVLSVRAKARPPALGSSWWRQRRRTGLLVCDLPAAGSAGLDLTGKEIEISVTPPDPALCGRWGCGMQVVLQDSAGRAMHGPWSGLAAERPGRHRLHFIPPSKAVPGIGFRQHGFDLRHVRSVGLLWAGSTFARFSFSSKLLVHHIRVRGARPQRCFGSDSSAAGRKRRWCDRCYRPMDRPTARVVRPKDDRPLGLSCLMRASDYPYFQGVGVGADGRSMVVTLDPKSAFARRGAVTTGLARDCRGSGRAPHILGALLDARRCRLMLRLSGSLPQSVPAQILLGDHRGRTCYVAAQHITKGAGGLAPPTSTALPSWSLSVDTGRPGLCASGRVDLAHLVRVGLAFGPVRRRVRAALSGLDVTVVCGGSALVHRPVPLALRGVQGGK